MITIDIIHFTIDCVFVFTSKKSAQGKKAKKLIKKKIVTHLSAKQENQYVEGAA